MPEPAIKVIPTPYQDVLALLRSEVLRRVEQAIAEQVGLPILEDYSSTCTSMTQADLSVSGMTVAECESLLMTCGDQVIAFGIGFLRDQEATRTDEEYPEGEEQDPSESEQVLGFGAGFAVKHAIYYNFLANRSPAQFQAYLKNRRIPHRAKFAKELRRVFEVVQAKSA